MAAQLKPCPFCGSDTAHALFACNMSNRVSCSQPLGGCGASGPYKSFSNDAVSEWNKRADQAKELAALRAFSIDAMDLSLGSDVHYVAIKHGLLQIETRTEPCSKECACIVFYGPTNMSHGVVCYRKTALLTGAEQ